MLFRIFTLLAVLCLAVSTWLLSTPGRTPSVAAPDRLAGRPGYFLKQTVLTEYDQNGDASVRIAAARIDQVDGGTAVNLSAIQVDYQAPGGTAWVMVGDAAQVEPGGKVVDISGNVRLEGAGRDRGRVPVVSTDRLSYDVSTAVAATQSDVRVDFLEDTLTARGLVANLRDRTVRLESRVNGRFHP